MMGKIAAPGAPVSERCVTGHGGGPLTLAMVIQTWGASLSHVSLPTTRDGTGY